MDPVIVAGVLREGTDEEREEALHALREPVEPALFDAIVEAVERGGERVRERGVWKLVRTSWVSPGAVDDTRMARLVAAGRKHRDGPMLVPLARTEGRPVDAVARAIYEEKLFATMYAQDALSDAIRDARVSASTVLELLERAEGDDEISAALILAERSYEISGDLGLRRAILKRFLSPGTAALRSKACWALRRAEKDDRSPAGRVRFRLVPADIEDVFGHPRNALLALLSLMNDDAALREVGVYDWLADLFKYRSDSGVRAMLASEPEAFREFLRAAVGIGKEADYWLYLRTGAISMLETLVIPEDRDFVLSLLDGIDGETYDLQYWVDRVREKLK